MYLLAVVTNALMKVAVGWVVYVLSNLMGFPEWLTIVWMIMAVQSTHFFVINRR